MTVSGSCRDAEIKSKHEATLHMAECRCIVYFEGLHFGGFISEAEPNYVAQAVLGLGGSPALASQC